MSRYLHTICILLVCASVALAADLTQYKNEEGFTCKQDTPSMTVGDIFISYRETLEKTQKENEVFILGVSQATCNECCKGEIILSQVMRLFETGDLQYNNGKIPVVRLDVEKHPKQFQSSGISLDGIPRIFLFFKGKYYLYDEGDNLNLFLLFLNKILHPVAHLSTDLQVENFRNPSLEYIESSEFYVKKYRGIRDIFGKMKKVVRLALFISDHEKYENVIHTVETISRDISERTTFRFALVTDKNLIQHYKDMKGQAWFNQTSTNSIVLFRSGIDPQGKQRFYDLETDDFELLKWINLSSLEEVEELSLTSMQIMRGLSMPIFLTLLPKDHANHQESRELMINLHSISHQYPHILFSYTEDTENQALRQQLTIIWDDLPSLGLLNNEEMMPVTFPRNQKFTLPNLHTFFDSFMNGTVNSYSFVLPDLNTDYSKNIPHALQIDLTIENEEEKGHYNNIMKSDSDTVLLIYDSTKSFHYTYQATFLFELCAMVFSEIKLSTVEFAFIDASKGTVPDVFKNDEKYPQLQVLPSKSKSSHPFPATKLESIEQLLDFIAAHSSSDISALFEEIGMQQEDQQDTQQGGKEEEEEEDVIMQDDL